MKGKILKTSLITALLTISFSVQAFAYTNIQDVINSIYNHMVNHDQTFVVSYEGEGQNLVDFASNVGETINTAVNLEDYLSLSWSYISHRTVIDSDSADVTVSVDYLSTKEQEEYAENKLSSVTSEITNSNMTEAEKIKAISDYICDLYTYDYTLTHRSVYDALTDEGNVTVCQGYAMTAYKMFKDAGLDCRIVVGTLNGVGHGWNKVRIGSQWYNIDLTNYDANNRNKEFYLVSDRTLINNGFSWDGSKYIASSDNYTGENVSGNTGNSQELIDKAEAALVKAENFKTDELCNEAQIIISSMKDDANKADFQKRLDAVIEAVNTNLNNNAEYAVARAEQYKTEDYINAAEAAIGKVKDQSVKADLVQRLNLVKEEFKKLNEDASEVDKALLNAKNKDKKEDILKVKDLILNLDDGSTKEALVKEINQVIKAHDERYSSMVKDFINLYNNHYREIYKTLANKMTDEIIDETIKDNMISLLP